MKIKYETKHPKGKISEHKFRYHAKSGVYAKNLKPQEKVEVVRFIIPVEEWKRKKIEEWKR